MSGAGDSYRGGIRHIVLLTHILSRRVEGKIMLSKGSHGEERGKLGVTINVVFGLLFVMTSSLASATTQYSVDATNSCGGDTPCYMTIQEAVDAAITAAESPALILVYPGTYNEAVQVYAFLGDITLRAVSASGESVSSASVTINGGAGPAISAYQTQGAPEITGSFTVSGFILKSDLSGENNCLEAHVSGTVAVSHVLAESCGNNGVSIYLSGDSQLAGQHITTNNNAFDGISVQFLPDTSNETYEVDLRNVVSNNNGDDGVNIDDDVNDDNITNGINDNPLTGTTVTLIDITASNNGDPTGETGDGIEVRVTDAMASLTNVTANSNGDDGVDIDQSALSIVVADSQANSNLDDGFDFDDAKTIQVDDSGADQNGSDGLDIYNDADEVHSLEVSITNFQANGNEEGIEIDNARRTSITGSTTNNNTGTDKDGLHIDNESLAGLNPPVVSNVSVINHIANNNADDGIFIGDTNSIFVSGGQANNNEDDGLDISNGEFDQTVTSKVDIANIKANGNGENCSCDGIEISDSTNVTISGVTTDNNAQDGIDIEDSTTVLIQNSSARGNAQDGLEIDVLVSFQGSNITSTGNAVGLLFQPESTFADPVEYIGDITLTQSIVSNNGDGILFTRAGPDSDISISSSDIAGNTIWGAGILGPREDEGTTYEGSSAEAVVVALNNYWGAASGPTHPSNPNGTGDVVADADSNVAKSAVSSTGTINFGNYRNKSITTSVPVPTLGGLALLLLTLLTAGIARRQFRRI